MSVCFKRLKKVQSSAADQTNVWRDKGILSSRLCPNQSRQLLLHCVRQVVLGDALKSTWSLGKTIASGDASSPSLPNDHLLK